MKTISTVLFAFFAALQACVVCGQEIQQNTIEQDATDLQTNSQDSDAAADTIALINHINYVVEVIRSYNTPLALEEEYQKITADNLNLNRIPDEEVLNLIREILNVLEDMRMNERDRARLHRVMTRSIDDAKIERTHKCATAFIGALQGRNRQDDTDTKGGKVASFFGSLPWLDIAQSAVDIHFEHKKIMQDLRNEFEDKQFELDTEKLKRLHELTDTLLSKEWALISRYGLDDKLRITAQEVHSLVECLKYADSKRCFTRLKPMAFKFEVYPTYWHYRAAMALSCGEYEEVLASCNHFEKINRGLFRYDPMAANVAMFMATAILQQQNQKAIDTSTKDTIRRCIETICDCNFNSENAEQGIFCASVYFFVLGDSNKALEVLDPLEARLFDESESELVDYCDLSKAPEKKPRKAPLTADIAQCRMLRVAIGQKTGASINVDQLKKICEQETTGSLEKLFYFGQLRVSDLWELAKKDILAINCCISDGNLVVQLPVSWFLLGDIDVELQLMRGKDVVSKQICNKGKFELIEEKAKLVDGSRTAIYGSYTMPVQEIHLKKSDGAKLKINHVSWPVEIDYVFSKPRTKTDQMFIPIEVVSFMNQPLGEKLMSDHDATEFKELIEKAENGDPEAQFLVGLYFYEGELVEQDYSEAVKWFKNAAENGDADAQYYLGQCYFTGRGVDENDKEAVSWFMKSAAQNNLEAQYKLGMACEYGWGVSKNNSEALKWYRKSVAQDDEGEASNARYRIEALEADVKRRSLICKQIGASGIKFGFRFFSLDTDELYLATDSSATHEKRDKAVDKVNEIFKTNIFEKDVLFWNEPFKEDCSTILLTANELFYLDGSRVKRWKLSEIDVIDWERKSDGNILVNGTPCKVVVYQRKPFVDAMKKILAQVRQEKK